MASYRFTYRIVIVYLATAYLMSGSAAARKAKEARTFIDSYMFGYSPRSAAMGFCGVNLVDGRSSFHNPAAMGLYHINNDFSATWVGYPKFNYPYDRLYNFGMSARIPYISDYLYRGDRFKTALSVGYSLSRLDYRPWGEPEYIWFDRSSYYSVGIGFEYFVKLGFGYMYNDVKTTLRSSFPEYYGTRVESSARDYGLIIELPVIEVLADLTGKDLSYEEFNFELAPSFAYVWSNIGGNQPIADRYDNVGISIQGKMKLGEVLLTSMLVLTEKENYKGGYYYGGYNITKYGYELSFGGFYFLRSGDYINEFLYFDFEGHTGGFGFSFNGISNWLYYLDIIEDKGRISDWILKNIDITYDVSNFDWGPGIGSYPRDDVFNIGISF
ncbi:MAG: hypothetical protein JSU85_00400 [Candidatus Zixiibacteriota bacterium]|nr:MAG: hypothetical protein JSU85_00400 [candidate division Zixibacteria bacterium]